MQGSKPATRSRWSCAWMVLGVKIASASVPAIAEIKVIQETPVFPPQPVQAKRAFVDSTGGESGGFERAKVAAKRVVLPKALRLSGPSALSRRQRPPQLQTPPKFGLPPKFYGPPSVGSAGSRIPGQRSVPPVMNLPRGPSAIPGVPGWSEQRAQEGVVLPGPVQKGPVVTSPGAAAPDARFFSKDVQDKESVPLWANKPPADEEWSAPPAGQPRLTCKDVLAGNLPAPSDPDMNLIVQQMVPACWEAFTLKNFLKSWPKDMPGGGRMRELAANTLFELQTKRLPALFWTYYYMLVNIKALRESLNNEKIDYMNGGGSVFAQ